ncbi:MAG: hypothetical protein KDC12_02380 [Flavobacteriales bacterium]|nr:hypothetical protein [Flavobacteriales bacterium]
MHKAVSQLIGIGDETSHQWFDIYDRYLKYAHTYPISDQPYSLLTAAEEGYNLMCAIISIENYLIPND